jgi:FkbM family methyltransferase
MEFLARQLLNIWRRIEIAPGWCYENIERYGQHLAKSNTFTGYLPNGCTITCNLQDHVQRHIYFFGVYEPIESYIFTSLLKDGMTVIDAGANIGQYSILASTIVGGQGRVHSFEPVPSTFEQLQRNISNNELTNCNLNQCALYSENGTITLSLSEEMLQNIGAYSAGANNSSTAVIVSTLCLDDYIREQNISKVDFIKMDIEGSEASALLGMKLTLERDRPILLIEINRSALVLMNSSPEILWSFLVEDLSYRPYLISGDSLKCVENFSETVQSNFLLIYEGKHDLVTEWNYKKVLSWAGQKKPHLPL